MAAIDSATSSVRSRSRPASCRHLRAISHVEKLPCSAQTQRQLQLLAEHLRNAYDILEEERAWVLQQHHIVSCLAEVLGQFRSVLELESGCRSHESQLHLEQTLLQHLETLHMPSAAMGACSLVQDNSSSSCSALQEDHSHSSYDLDTVSSNCRSSSILQQQRHLDGQVACCKPTTAVASLCGMNPAAGSSWLSQAFHQPVCPDSDPFGILRTTLAHPPDVSAIHITFADLCRVWTADARKLQHCLQQLNTTGLAHQATADLAMTAGSTASAAPEQLTGSADKVSVHMHNSSGLLNQQHMQQMEIIREVQLRMCNMLFSLSSVGKENLVFALHLTDWVTGERRQEPCKQRHREALRQLNLTAAQEQRITQGWLIHQRLFTPVLLARKRLQAVGVIIPQNGAASAAPDATGLSSCTAEHTAGRSGLAAAYTPHGAQLQAQGEQVAQLQVLARKEMLLRGALAAYVQGCLSWIQQAQLRVSMSPYHVSVATLCVVLMEQRKQQHQQ